MVTVTISITQNLMFQRTAAAFSVLTPSPFDG